MIQSVQLQKLSTICFIFKEIEKLKRNDHIFQYLDTRGTLGLDDVSELGSSDHSGDHSMMANLWVHCLVFQLDKMLEPSWVLLVVLLVVIQMACLRDKHWKYHLDLLMVKHLAWMKASY